MKSLTKREQEIIKLIVKGLTYEAIAKTLFVSTQTVYTHTRNIKNKVKARNKTQIMLFFLNSYVGKEPS